MGSRIRSDMNYRNPCLTMHQPWASLLVYGIKRIEGRSWPSPVTGRLWIHAAGKKPETETIEAMKDFYKQLYALDGVTDLKFPEDYPVGRLIGCVEVVGCVKSEELASWEDVSQGVRLEGLTPFCWLCEQPQKLIVPVEMRGYQGVYNLEKKVLERAVRGLRPVEPPIRVKFPLPDPRNPLSLKPGSLVNGLRNGLNKSKTGEGSPPDLAAAIAGARAAATQFSRKNYVPPTPEAGFKGEGSATRSNTKEDEPTLEIKTNSAFVPEVQTNLMESRSRGDFSYRNSCLTMHQPWASLLVYGIKRIEGRSWPSPVTGRLWIHAAGKKPDPETIKAMENFYKQLYALDGVTDLKFPEEYPVSKLLGCVEVVGCVNSEELASWEDVPRGVRLEGLTPLCWLCEQPQKLLEPFNMRGDQGVYNLEKTVLEQALGDLRPVEPPLRVKFPLPDPRNPFSLKPGSLVNRVRNGPSKAKTGEGLSPDLAAAIAGARAAATQFSKKNYGPPTAGFKGLGFGMKSNIYEGGQRLKNQV